MPKVTQTKIFNDLIKNFSNNQFSDEQGQNINNNLKIIYKHPKLFLIENNNQIFIQENQNLAIILPYDINLYDEIESVFFVKGNNVINNESYYYALLTPIEFNENPQDTVLKFLRDQYEIDINGDYQKIKELSPINLSFNHILKIYPFFVNITGMKFQNKSDANQLIEVDVSNLFNFKITDLYLLYLLSIISDVL